MPKTRLMTGAGLALALALAAPAASAQKGSAPAPSAWAHTASDLKPDERVRFGVLPNGMRYALMRNATPPGVASLRMRIDAGSLNERDDQQGLAHFLEHMTLNETRNFPEGELLKTLERTGLKFGPDTNASTSFEQQVFMLDLPKADAATIDTGLYLMREVAGEATLSKAGVDSERNIIASEERARDTPANRMGLGELTYIFGDDLLSRRLPIGKTDVIRTAPRERLVEFYNAYFRPERATLIAVGDFDVAQMEAKVRARFSDWKGKGAPGANPPAPAVPSRATRTKVLVDPGVPTRMSLNWLTPIDPRPDSAAVRRERIVQQLGMRMINQRLERVATSATPPPFIGAGAGNSRVARRGEVAQFIAVSETGKWQPALAAIEQEQRRVVQHGFTAPELSRAVTELRAGLTAAATGAATRSSPALAMEIVGAVNEHQVFVTPAATLALFEAAVAGLTPAQVGVATAKLFPGVPQIFLASPVPIATGETAVLSAFNQSRAVAVAAPAVQQAKVWPYKEFGKPGAVVERREIPGTGATAVRFANGVRLTVKQTAFADDEILVSARFGQGQIGLAPDQPNPVWALPQAFPAGGLGKLTFEELQEVLAGVVGGAGAGVAENAFTLTGKTRPQDVATQLQLLAAYLQDPAWRPTGWDRLRNLSGTIHDQYETSPGGVLGRDLPGLLRSGDPRWATPGRTQMATMTVADMRRAIEGATRNGPLEVVIVGDIGVDEAIRQTAATFGALPPRQAPAAMAGQTARFPAPATVTRTHAGRPDQALAFLAWPTTDYYADQRQTRGLSVLSQVILLRLNAEIREKQGTAYTPVAFHDASDNLKGYGYLAALIETAPGSVDGFYRDVLRIAQDLRDKPVTEDELQRARKPLVEGIARRRSSSNQWWVDQLAGVQERPERAEGLRVGMEQYAAITPAELQQLARKYLVDAKAWRLAINPKPKAS